MIDSHCHINDELYSKNPAEYIKYAINEGVFEFFVIGSNLKDSKIAIEIAEQNSCCYAAVGIHPSDTKNYSESSFEELEKMIKNKNVIAIGEIGLDYYWDREKEIIEKQKNFFIKQIELANKYNLPVSIHCRDALEDCLNILKKHPVNKKGVLHCYSGSLEMAKEFIKLGYVLGFGGTTTYKNAVKPKEVVANIGDNDFLLETDSPYLTPVPHRGKPNHSMYLKYVRDEIAKLRNCDPEYIDKITTENFRRVFKNEKNN